MPESPMIHKHTSSPGGALVNAYPVEAEHGVVAVDSMLTVTDSRMPRRRLEELGKPLLAVSLTRRDDPVKEEILRPMFGDEWPRRRTFPNTVVDGGRPWSSTASAPH